MCQRRGAAQRNRANVLHLDRPILTQIDRANAPIWVQFWACQYYQLYHHLYIPNLCFGFVLVLEIVAVACTKAHPMVHPPSMASEVGVRTHDAESSALCPIYSRSYSCKRQLSCLICGFKTFNVLSRATKLNCSFSYKRNRCLRSSICKRLHKMLHSVRETNSI